jgi:hypothetical protein
MVGYTDISIRNFRIAGDSGLIRELTANAGTDNPFCGILKSGKLKTLLRSLRFDLMPVNATRVRLRAAALKALRLPRDE